MKVQEMFDSDLAGPILEECPFCHELAIEGVWCCGQRVDWLLKSGKLTAEELGSLELSGMYSVVSPGQVA